MKRMKSDKVNGVTGTNIEVLEAGGERCLKVMKNIFIIEKETFDAVFFERIDRKV